MIFCSFFITLGQLLRPIWPHFEVFSGQKFGNAHKSDFGEFE